MSRYDRLLASAPIDRLAALQTSKGVHWEPRVHLNPHGRRYDAPPPFAPHPVGIATFEDLSGRRCGRFTVAGYLGKLNPKKKALWLCRCACGNYETRDAKAIKAANPEDACEHCRYLERMKRGEHRPTPTTAQSGD